MDGRVEEMDRACRKNGGRSPVRTSPREQTERNWGCKTTYATMLAVKPKQIFCLLHDDDLRSVKTVINSFLLFKK